jgi:Class II flagellar assembly regulator
MNVQTGKICRGIYRRLTIKAQFGRYSGTGLRPAGIFAMRIYGPNGTALASALSTARRTSGGTFSVSEEETPARNSTGATSLRSISNVDALMALQGVDDPAERKKRAVKQGRNALDVLDALKISVLDGTIDQSTLSRLKVAADGLTQGSGDPQLDGVLGEIDLRVQVELAKAGVR